MSFPDYVTAHWPDPAQPDLAARVFASRRLTTALGYLGSNPAHRPATLDSDRIDGAALRGEGFDPSDVASVLGNISGVQIRSFFSTFRGGDSPVA
jgi:hypothetical protein